MAETVNVVLKNAQGQAVTYSGVSKVVLDTDTGETAEFSLGGGGTSQEIPDYVVQNGDVLTKLYFNRNFDLRAIFEQYGGILDFPIAIGNIVDGALDTSADNLMIAVQLEGEAESAADKNLAVYATLKQGESASKLTMYSESMGGWLVPYLDLTPFGNLGTAVVTERYVYDGTLPLFAKEAVPEFNTFGGGESALSFAHGDVVSEVCFNQYEVPDAMGPGVGVNIAVVAFQFAVEFFTVMVEPSILTNGVSLFFPTVISSTSESASIEAPFGLRYYYDSSTNPPVLAAIDPVAQKVVWCAFPFDLSSVEPWIKSDTAGFVNGNPYVFAEPRTFDCGEGIPTAYCPPPEEFAPLKNTSAAAMVFGKAPFTAEIPVNMG